MIEANQGRISTIRGKTDMYKKEINQKEKDLEDLNTNEAAQSLQMSARYI
jgi:hypothetical protein